MFRRILVPVDIAEPDRALQALSAVAELAEASGGDVRLVYVVHVVESALRYLPQDFFEKQEKRAREELDALAGRVSLPRERVSVASPVGDVHREVIAAAKAFEADLIVVGSHKPSMGTYFLGSNAAWIVRHATMSVLVVR